MRTFVRTALIVFAVSFAATGWAKKGKHHKEVVRSIPGGANQRWACEQLAENACDVAKRCEPDYSLRRCKKLRERCKHAANRASRSATEDDVSVCAQAVNDLDCKQVRFDNAYGVKFDLHKLDTCGPVAKDDPMPAPTGPEAHDDDADDAQQKKPAADDDTK